MAARGVDLARLSSAEPYLRLPGGAALHQRALVGARLAERLHLAPGRRLPLDLPNGRRLTFRVAALLPTGGPEEDQVLVDLALLRGALGAPERITRLAVVSGAMGRDLEARAARLRGLLPGARVRVGRESELPAAVLLDQWRSLLAWAAGFVVLAAAASVLATGLALRDRDRAQLALLRALGVRDSEVLRAGLLESLVLGFAGGFLGAILGYMMAWWMAHNLSSGGIRWDFRVLGCACLVSILLASLSSAMAVK